MGDFEGEIFGSCFSEAQCFSKVDELMMGIYLVLNTIMIENFFRGFLWDQKNYN